MIPCGQELDWDWSGKSLSPQGQSQSKYASNLQFLRQWFLFFYHSLPCLLWVPLQLWRQTVIRQIVWVQNKNLRKQQWREANKQSRLGTGFVTRGKRAPIFVIKPSSVALAKKTFLLICQLLLFKMRIIFFLTSLTCCFVEQVLRFFKARFIFTYYST